MEPKSVYVVVSENGIQGSATNFKKMEKIAKSLVGEGASGVVILEVINSWSVELPEEPEPESNELNIKDIG